MAPFPPIEDWLVALEERHLSDLRFAEVRRSIQALSQRYVTRPDERSTNRALQGRGLRAAFALYFAPLHLLTTRRIVAELEPSGPVRLLDLGCGTGAVAAGWAQGAGSTRLQVLGVDRVEWALGEARWNWSRLGVQGKTRRGDLGRSKLDATDAVLLGWTLNELDDPSRDAMFEKLLAAAERGVRVLIVEPISRRITPWWDRWAERVIEAGGRNDEWRFAGDLPERLREFDRAAGLDHRELTARSLWLSGRRTTPRRPA